MRSGVKDIDVKDPKYRKLSKEYKKDQLNKYAGSIRKELLLTNSKKTSFPENYAHFEEWIKRDGEYMEIILSQHPDFEKYGPEEKDKVFTALRGNPRFQADFVMFRNLVAELPSGPTSTRTMYPDEQKFLTNAFRDLKEAMQKNPFHIHGETAISGDRDGQINYSEYIPRQPAKPRYLPEERYMLYSRPTFGRASVPDASLEDHITSAKKYNELDTLKMSTYLTNGKDVLHLEPHTAELVKLIPDPKAEQRLGKFPVAFQVPEPRQPSYPFSNHEAPAAFKPWDPTRQSPAKSSALQGSAEASAPQLPAISSAPQASAEPSTPQSPAISSAPQASAEPSTPQSPATSSSPRTPTETPSSSHVGDNPLSPSDSLPGNLSEESASPVAHNRRQRTEGRRRRPNNAPNRAEAPPAVAGPSTPTGTDAVKWSLSKVPPRSVGKLSKAAEEKANLFRNYIRQGYSPIEAAKKLGQGAKLTELNASTGQYEIRLNYRDRLTFLSDEALKTVTILEIGGHT